MSPSFWNISSTELMAYSLADLVSFSFKQLKNQSVRLVFRCVNTQQNYLSPFPLGGLGLYTFSVYSRWTSLGSLPCSFCLSYLNSSASTAFRGIFSEAGFISSLATSGIILGALSAGLHSSALQRTVEPCSLTSATLSLMNLLIWSALFSIMALPLASSSSFSNRTVRDSPVFYSLIRTPSYQSSLLQNSSNMVSACSYLNSIEISCLFYSFIQRGAGWQPSCTGTRAGFSIARLAACSFISMVDSFLTLAGWRSQAYSTSYSCLALAYSTITRSVKVQSWAGSPCSTTILGTNLPVNSWAWLRTGRNKVRTSSLASCTLGWNSLTTSSTTSRQESWSLRERGSPTTQPVVSSTLRQMAPPRVLTSELIVFLRMRLISRLLMGKQQFFISMVRLSSCRISFQSRQFRQPKHDIQQYTNLLSCISNTVAGYLP